MKKLLIVALLLGGLSIGACKKDKQVPTSEKLIGKWTFVKYTEKFNEEPEETHPMPANTFFEFKADKNLVKTDENGVENVTQWEFLADGKLHLADKPLEDYTITQIGAHNLIYSTESVDAADNKTVITYYFTK